MKMVRRMTGCYSVHTMKKVRVVEATKRIRATVGGSKAVIIANHLLCDGRGSG